MTRPTETVCYLDHLYAKNGASSGPWKHPPRKPSAPAWMPLCIIGGAFVWVGIILALLT